MSDKERETIEMPTEEVATNPDQIASTPVTPPKKKPSKCLVVILSIVFLLLIAGGITAYTLLKPAQKDTPTATTPTTPAKSADTKPTEKLTAEQLVAATKTGMGGTVKVTTKYDASSEPYNNFAAPVYKPSGYDFSVRPSIDYGYTSNGTKTTIASDLATIEKVLKDKGLKGTVLDAGSADGMYAATYESDDIICGVGDQKPYQPAANSTEYSTTIGCANKSDYLGNAIALKPFFIVYAAQSTYDTTQVAMSGLAITDSKTANYKTAVVSIGGSEYASVGGFAGLFYRTPDNIWHYFKGTQSEIPCTDYNTTDIKKAYVGEACYDPANDAAVVTF